MKEFMLLFRQPSYDFSQTSPKEMAELAGKWKSWVEGIAAQGYFVNNGSRLDLAGKVLRPGGVVTDGPFVEIKEKLGGYIVIKAASIDEALTLAHGCPVLEADGSVEVRPIYG
ncbi:hypothetical protein CLV59_11357 [Chitinophaga dinghuensis]|uniref:YCII-related domain-containing protein n=1 Tax=Chitinophaga dinghuensis TaxID=1539050 RepID=A0A327VI01_9BACT|nr:YciI family protein [Chitinophaga dinghuensis]RAJ73504.1 hypothetical protein CLV59_11357 [Chitinophaga dinghuensis]